MDGSELTSVAHSWPSLVSAKLGMTFRSHALGGAGNLRILDSILAGSLDDSLCVINWTWIDRFDYCSSNSETWETLRPSLDHPHGSFYFKNLHGQYRDMLTNLLYIKTAIDYLNQNSVKFVMTYMDHALFDNVWTTWQDARSIHKLQRYVKPYLKSFDGKDFLTWSKQQKFDIGKLMHPLEQAHQAAADYWLPHIKEIL